MHSFIASASRYFTFSPDLLISAIIFSSPLQAIQVIHYADILRLPDKYPHSSSPHLRLRMPETEIHIVVRPVRIPHSMGRSHTKCINTFFRILPDVYDPIPSPECHICHEKHRSHNPHLPDNVLRQSHKRSPSEHHFSDRRHASPLEVSTYCPDFSDHHKTYIPSSFYSSLQTVLSSQGPDFSTVLQDLSLENWC